MKKPKPVATMEVEDAVNELSEDECGSSWSEREIDMKRQAEQKA